MRIAPPAYAVLAAAILLALGACDRGAVPATPAASAAPAGEPAAATPVPAPATVAAPAPAVASAATSAAPAASASPAAPAATATAIASADGEKAGMRIEVTELKHSSGDTVSLKFALINDTDGDFGIQSAYLGDTKVNEDYASVGGVQLVDPVGKKKYMVVRDDEHHCVCSDNVRNIPAHSRANLWAKYPAPPADTTKVSIVVPHFTPMDDVAIAP